MFVVRFGYYNYPKKERTFKTYEAAKKFFYAVGRNSAVKNVELISV